MQAHALIETLATILAPQSLCPLCLNLDFSVLLFRMERRTISLYTVILTSNANSRKKLLLEWPDSRAVVGFGGAEGSLTLFCSASWLPFILPWEQQHECLTILLHSIRRVKRILLNHLSVARNQTDLPRCTM